MFDLLYVLKDFSLFTCVCLIFLLMLIVSFNFQIYINYNNQMINRYFKLHSSYYHINQLTKFYNQWHCSKNFHSNNNITTNTFIVRTTLEVWVLIKRGVVIVYCSMWTDIIMFEFKITFPWTCLQKMNYQSIMSSFHINSKSGVKLKAKMFR